MTKKEIANQISTDMGIPQSVVLTVVRRTFESIIAALESEGRIELRDFAVFEVVTRKGRIARNPRTGARVIVPDRERVKFTPGKEMTKRIRAPGDSDSSKSMNEDKSKYSGMTLNERLYHAKLLNRFDEAIAARQVEKAVAILEEVEIEAGEARETVNRIIKGM